MDTLITVFVRILEAIFIVGLLGSAVVLMMTLVEDAKSLMPEGKKETEQASARSRQAAASMHAPVA